MTATEAKHSSATAEWFTPPSLLGRVRKVLGTIDLDPASCEAAQRIVRAGQWIGPPEDALRMREWPAGSCWVNPPGGTVGGKSVALFFWRRLMAHREAGLLTHGIFLAFNAELLQVSQGRSCPAISDFTVCAPAKRVRYLGPDGRPGEAPPHSSLIVYVPGLPGVAQLPPCDASKLFAEVFSDMGAILKQVRPLRAAQRQTALPW